MTTIKRLTFVLTVSTLCLFSSQAFAQIAVEGGNGLFYVEKARPLGHKSFGIGAFYTDEKWDDNGISTKSRLASVPLTVGLLDKFEISAQFQTATYDPDGLDSTSGATDGLAKAKWNFLNSEKHNMLASLVALVTLPTGDKDKGLGTGDTDVGAVLAIDKEYEKVSWHFNIGYMNHQAEGLDLRTIYGAGLEWYALDDLSVIAEVSGQSWADQIQMRDDNTRSMAGIRYYLGDWGSLSLGYASWSGGSGIKSPGYQWTAGINIGVGLRKKRVEREEAPVAEPEIVEEAVPVAEEEAEAAPVAEPPAEKVITIVLESVHFAFDSAELTDEAKATLRANAQKLNANPGIKLVIEGHTCSIGPKGYNYKLGLRRAKAAKLYLAKKVNVDPDRMFVITSYGEERPAHSNETREGRKLNRRVDFVINVR